MGNKIDFAKKRKQVTVNVAELEEPVTLVALSMKQMNTLKNGDEEAGIKQLAMSIVNGNGERLYTTEEDLDNLREMSLGVFRELISALNTLHGVTKEETEEVVKKFVASQSTASASV